MNILQSSFWRRGIALCLAVALSLAGCAGPQRQQQIARAPASITLAGIVVDGSRQAGEHDSGLMRVWRDGRAMDGRVGLALVRGDFIETGPRADALIIYPSGSRLYIRPGSSGQIGSLSSAVGEFFAKIKGIFSIESSFVRAAANGTSFLVQAQPDGAMSVTVHEGNVIVDSTRGLWARILIGPGTMVTAHERASPPMQASRAEMGRTQQWTDDVDRMLQPTTANSGSSVAGAVAIGVAIAAAAALLSSRDKDKPANDGRDQLDSTRPSRAAPALAAPLARGPGKPGDVRPADLTCPRRGITLSWRGVTGARDYLVTLQTHTSPRLPWVTVTTQESVDQRIDFIAEEGRRYRWWVQARDARGTGPGSATLYFDCRLMPR